MNVQHLTRIGLVYLEEAILWGLSEGKENGEGAIRQAEISKRTGLHELTGGSNWIVAEI